MIPMECLGRGRWVVGREQDRNQEEEVMEADKNQEDLLQVAAVDSQRSSLRSGVLGNLEKVPKPKGASSLFTKDRQHTQNVPHLFIYLYVLFLKHEERNCAKEEESPSTRRLRRTLRSRGRNLVECLY